VDDRPNGVLAAIAIVLLWLAGVCFFVAFEGGSILGEALPAAGGGGASYFKAALQGLTTKTQTLQADSATEGSQA
jgi:hypothetical protein